MILLKKNNISSLIQTYIEERMSRVEFNSPNMSNHFITIQLQEFLIHIRRTHKTKDLAKSNYGLRVIINSSLNSLRSKWNIRFNSSWHDYTISRRVK